MRPLAAWLVLASILMSPVAASEPTGVQRGGVNDGGVAVAWSYTPQDDTIGLLDVYLRDGLTSAPLRIDPKNITGWLQRDRKALSDNEMSCAQRVTSLLAQGVGRKADVDFNTYRIVTLNSDGSLAFINPFVGFNNAKLEAIIDLKSVPLDWFVDQDRMEAWILAADSHIVVGIDLQRRKQFASFTLPPDSGVQHIFLDADGRVVAAMPRLGKIGFIDRQRMLFRSFDAPGLVDVIAVKNAEPLRVSAIAVYANGTSRMISDGKLSSAVDLGTRPQAAIWSTFAQRIVVAGPEPGLRVIRDPQDVGTHGMPLTALWPLPAAARAMALLQDGRTLFVVGGGHATAIDLSAGKSTLTASTAADVNGIIETNQFVYALGSVSGRALLFAKDDIKHGRYQPLDVMLSSPESVASPVSENGRIAVAADGNGVLAAGGSDGMIYQYSEGMMAPAGSYSNYRRGALGVAVVNHGLKEIEPGHFRAAVRPEMGGRHDLVLAGSNPRFAACGQLSLAGQSTAAVAAPTFNVVLEHENLEHKIRVRVSSGAGGASKPLSGLRDLVLLVFDKQTGWQSRAAMREISAGEYQADVSVPRSARYSILAQSSMANLSFLEGNMGETRLEARQ